MNRAHALLLFELSLLELRHGLGAALTLLRGQPRSLLDGPSSSLHSVLQPSSSTSLADDRLHLIDGLARATCSRLLLRQWAGPLLLLRPLGELHSAVDVL